MYPGSAVTIPDGSAQTISYWSVDNAGNTETTHTTSALKIDTVAPVTTITLNPSSPNGSNGWYKGPQPDLHLVRHRHRRLGGGHDLLRDRRRGSDGIPRQRSDDPKRFGADDQLLVGRQRREYRDDAHHLGTEDRHRRPRGGGCKSPTPVATHTTGRCPSPSPGTDGGSGREHDLR